MFFTKPKYAALLIILFLNTGITMVQLCRSAPVSAADSDSWEILTPEHSPPARFGHTLVNVNGNLYLFGGFNFLPDPSVYYNDLWRWDGSDWTELTPANPPPARSGHSASVSGGKMYIFFGGAAGNMYGDVWAYDPQTNDWDQQLDGATGRASAGAATLPNGHILLLGGMDAANNVLNDFWEYDPDADSWTQKPDPPLSGRYGGFYAAALTGLADDKEVAFSVHGGHDGNKPLNDTWIYHIKLLDPRAFAAATKTNGNPFVAGGEGEGYTELQDSWEYDSDVNTWTRRADLPHPLIEGAAANMDGSGNRHAQRALQAAPPIIVFGGMSGGQPISTTLRYTAAVPISGDVNYSGAVDLGDVILALQICANVNSSSDIYVQADVNGDSKINLAEAIYALQFVSEIRGL